MPTIPTSLAAWRGPAAALGLLVFRLHLGVVMVEAGWPKLGTNDWFTQQVADLGFTWPSPVLWAGLAAWGEFVGGIMLILGLGTRWAAVQLSFQFFVISFLWYGKPEFFTGMYVQQEMFWGFVLLLATGAGRWSVDAWLRGKGLGVWGLAPYFRKPALAAVFVVLLPLAGMRPAGPAQSNLYIGPGKQFLLGGSQREAFEVAAKNVGLVAVEIKERPLEGGVFAKAALAPGQQGVLRFAAGATGVFLNPHRLRAHLRLTLTGDTKQLRMDYEPVRVKSGRAAAPRVSGRDLSMAQANDWHGTLTYLDYGTGKSVRLNTAMRGQMPRADQLVLTFDYEEPNKSHVFGADTLAIGPDGTRVRWDGTTFAVIARQMLPARTLRLVLEGPGRDDNRAVTIRKTVLLSAQQFSVRKQVRLVADTAFLQRNYYQLSR